VFEASRVRAVDDYPSKLLAMLEHLAPDHIGAPTIGVLTPGIYNSAYFEHSFLFQQMGVELVEGQDLVVSEGFVHMLTTKGLKRVDVLYRVPTMRVLDVKYFMLLPRSDLVNSPIDNIQWTAVLKSASAFEMFRKQHHQITPPRRA
jgi:hypothetical protein